MDELQSDGTIVLFTSYQCAMDLSLYLSNSATLVLSRSRNLGGEGGRNI